MSIRCAHCHGRHESVGAVRRCGGIAAARRGIADGQAAFAEREAALLERRLRKNAEMLEEAAQERAAYERMMQDNTV